MTPKTRWHRIDAYARASKRAHHVFRLTHDAIRLKVNELPALAMLEQYRERERHAWARLPENLKASIQP